MSHPCKQCAKRGQGDCFRKCRKWKSWWYPQWERIEAMFHKENAAPAGTGTAGC